jgi:DNA-directed RNA polymerase specialized sigma24 family protein
MAASEHGSTSRLIELARQGNDDAKWQLWSRYLKFLYVVAHGVVHNMRSGEADTDDVVQDAAVRFFETDMLRNVQDRTHFRNYMRRLVHGKGIDQLRRKEARPAIPLADDLEQAPSGPDVKDFFFTDMHDLLNALPLTLHETALAYMEHGNERDTVEVMGITRHEFRNRKAAIREIWSKKLGEE